MTKTEATVTTESTAPMAIPNSTNEEDTASSASSSRQSAALELKQLLAEIDDMNEEKVEGDVNLDEIMSQIPDEEVC